MMLKKIAFIFMLNLSGFLAQSLFKSGDPRKVMAGSRMMCEKFSTNPNFEPEKVIGLPWRIVHTWNMKIDQCLDLRFKKATTSTVERIREDMSDYLEMQPEWAAATLVASLGISGHELLLFADQGAAGTFVGVPNIKRSGDLISPRQAAPLLKFQLKLVHNNRYLIMMDCSLGVVTMAIRPSHPVPYRVDILNVAKEFDFGDSFPSCTRQKHRDEFLGA